MARRISVEWHNHDHTVIFVRAKNGWTWGDMYQAVHEINNLLDSVDYPVCTLFDFTNANHVLPNAIKHLRNLNQKAHPNQGKVAIQGLNLFGESMINIFIRVYGKLAKGSDAQFVKSHAEAYLFFDIEMNASYGT